MTEREPGDIAELCGMENDLLPSRHTESDMCFARDRDLDLRDTVAGVFPGARTSFSDGRTGYRVCGLGWGVLGTVGLLSVGRPISRNSAAM